jgi:hypothetical protein
MTQVPVRFVIGELSEDDVAALAKDQTIISKMILTIDDFAIFHYKEGDSIQVETETGYRHWCEIVNLETISDETCVVIIFTLKQVPDK